MKIIKKIVNFFTKTKTKLAFFKTQAEIFIDQHRDNIKVLMNIFQSLYEKNKGTEKMQSVVQNVFSAMGAKSMGDEYADDITTFIETKCQKIYDELVEEGGLNK